MLVPVLRRPQNVKPLLESIRSTTPQAHVVFIADPDDVEEQRAILKTDARMILLGGSYARKVNAAVKATTEDLLFIGADDLTFLPGWFEAARARLSDETQVVGVNDLIERRPERKDHATHFLMTREYAEQPCIDGGPGPLCERYDHSWVDNELIATATKRGVYAYAKDSHVRHEHPMAGGEDDDVYRKGRARFRQDHTLFLRRSRLWT